MYKPGFLASFESEGLAAVVQDPMPQDGPESSSLSQAHLPLSPHCSSHSWHLTLLLTEH